MTQSLVVSLSASQTVGKASSSNTLLPTVSSRTLWTVPAQYGGSARRKPLSRFCPLVGVPKIQDGDVATTAGVPFLAGAMAGPNDKGGDPIARRPMTTRERSCRSFDSDLRRPMSSSSRSLLDLHVWTERITEIEALSACLAGDDSTTGAVPHLWPNSLLSALACDAAARLAPTQTPQHMILRSLMSIVDCTVYCEDQHVKEGKAAVKEGEEVLRPGTSEFVAPAVPARYAGRVPYFVIGRRQAAQLEEARSRARYLQKIMRRSTGLHYLAPRLCTMSQQVLALAVTVWAFGFWRVFHTEQKRLKRKKAELLLTTVVGDTIQPFTHWKIFHVETLAESTKNTRTCFLLEKRMLTVEVKDLEEQRSDIREALQRSTDSSGKAQLRLDEEVKQCQALEQRLEEARPALVRSALCSALNIVFEGTLREAQLCRVAARRILSTKELSVLLSYDEDELSALTNHSIETLLTRWVNHNLARCKVVATEIFDSLARARDDTACAESRTASEWSSRDAESYLDRCRIVRGMQKITNLDEDLKDGAVLTTLYAMIASAKCSTSGFNPVALSPLDYRDPEQRVAKLVDALRMVIPTRSLQCLLKPADITRTNTPLVKTMLAALFLTNSTLPSMYAEEVTNNFVGIPSGDLSVMSGTGAGGAPQACASAALAMEPMATPHAEHEHMEPTMRHMIAIMESVGATCAYDSLQDVALLLRRGEAPSDLELLQPGELLLRWLNLKLERKSRDRIKSIAELKGGRELMDLLRKIASDVVTLMPEARLLPEMRGSNPEPSQATSSEVEQLRAQLVVDCGSRCTTYDILTKQALVEGHADMLAAFLVGLFLSRPSLPVGQKSPLWRHVEHIEATVRESSSAQFAKCMNCGNPFPDDSNTCSKCMGSRADCVDRSSGGACTGAVQRTNFAALCQHLQSTRSNFAGAVRAVEAARDLHMSIERRLQTFLGHILAQRARGTPLKVSCEQEVQDSNGKQLLPPDRLRSFVLRETCMSDSNAFKDNVTLLEDVFRKHGGFFGEMFNHYSMDGPNNPNHGHHSHHGHHAHHGHHSHHGHHNKHFTAKISGDGTSEATGFNGRSSTVDLHGLMRIYRECRLRLMGLLPKHIENIYSEVKQVKDVRDELEARKNPGSPKQPQSPGCSSTIANDAGLPFEDFVEALLLFAARGEYEAPAALPEKVNHLAEKYLWPFACRPCLNLFYMLCRDADVRSICSCYENELRAIFNAYGVVSQSSGASKPDVGLGARSIAVSGFTTMLEHAALLSGRLDANAVRKVFVGIRSIEGQDHGHDNPAEEEDALPSKSATAMTVPCNAVRRKSVVAAMGTNYAAEVRRKSLHHNQRSMGILMNHAIHDLEEATHENEDPEIPFVEFFDCLIAVTLYKDPNPFAPFANRVERVVRDSLLKTLRARWHKVSPDAGLGKTLAQLQKGREDAAKREQRRASRRGSSSGGSRSSATAQTLAPNVEAVAKPQNPSDQSAVGARGAPRARSKRP